MSAADSNFLEQLNIDNEMQGKYLRFWTDGQLFGIPIAAVVSITEVQEITAIPEFPYYAKGVINLRGLIFPVLDMRLRLGRSEAAYNDRTCIIVTSIGDKMFGFIVDEVDEVSVIDDDRISPPPQIGRDDTNRFLTGVAHVENEATGGETIVLIIDASKIIGDDELAMAE